MSSHRPGLEDAGLEDGGLEDGAPETPSPAPRLRWLRRLVAVVVALVVLSAAATAIYVGSVSRSFTHHVARDDLLPSTHLQDLGRQSSSTDDGSPAPDAGATGAVNYVLMGSDSRDTSDAEAGRSDALMVLHLAADRKSAYLISFPRDMYVPVPGHGRNKINAAFSYGGPKLAISTLEGLLQSRMDHAALIDFDGFISLTDNLGGVTVVNQHKSSSRGYDFPAGPITLQGDRALAYVRERYELPRGDLDRAARQRDVVTAILDKGLSPETVANPVKFNAFVAGISEHLTIDSQLSDAEIRRTALSLRLTGSDIHQLQAPISGFATVRGQSIDVVDQGRMKQLAQAVRTDTVQDYLSSNPDR